MMNNQMCWLFPNDRSSKMILHLRENIHQPWRPYTSYSQYFVPDYKVPGGSKGWATYQNLREKGWTLVSNNPEVKNLSIFPELVTANFSAK